MNFSKVLMALTVVALVGCSGGTTPVQSEKKTTAMPQSDSGLIEIVLKEKPQDAKDVTILKKTAKEGDEVVIRGQVGGEAHPFTKGRAQMLIASLESPEMKSCNLNPEDKCETPWDFCCVPKDVIVANTATIQVTDKDGQPLKSALEGLNGLKPLDVVIVKGVVAKRPNEKVLIVNAKGLYIERK